jgi:hypothetical protein
VIDRRTNWRRFPEAEKYVKKSPPQHAVALLPALELHIVWNFT